MRGPTSSGRASIGPVLDGDQIIRLQDVVDGSSSRFTSSNTSPTSFAAPRPKEGDAPPYVRDLIGWGAGPRACQYLILGGKARAILNGRLHVTTDDVRAIAAPVLRHRLVTTFHADAEGITTDDVVRRLLKDVPLPQEEGAAKVKRGA